MKYVGIGLLGYGSIGKVHALCYHEIPHFYPKEDLSVSLAAVCTSCDESAARAQKEGGFLKSYSNVDELLDDDKVTVIDCSLPNYLRVPVIQKVLEKQKHIYCEKPLANTLKEAEQIYAMAQKTDVKFGMTFNNRFIPAVIKAKELIDAGELGEVYHYNIKYYHTGYQNAARPLTWRLQKDTSGGGALVDMGAHIIDLMRYMVGEYESVRAYTKTWVKSRPLSQGSSETGTVDVDDATWIIATMVNGAVGSIETSRFATGTLDDLIFEVFASKGSVRFHLMDANWLYYFDDRSAGGSRGGKRGWTRIETVQNYPGATTPPARSILGWTRMHAENQYRFLKSVVEDTAPSPSIEDGLAVQRVLESAYTSAAQQSAVVRVTK